MDINISNITVVTVVILSMTIFMALIAGLYASKHIEEIMKDMKDLKKRIYYLEKEVYK